MPDLVPGAVQCDECGAVKRFVNRWWAAWIHYADKHIVIAPFGSYVTTPDAILCGEYCLMKWMSREMPKLQQEQPV